MTSRRLAWVVAAGAFAVAFGAGGVVQTTALVSDADGNPGNVLTSVTRLSEIPSECAHLAPFDNVLTGDEGSNTISGENGRKDLIFGLGGDDTLNGDSQDDCLVGGSGVDTLNGGPGQDVLVGGSGGDFLHGDQGKDLLYGGDDPDTLYGDNAQDVLNGGEGVDLCSGDRAPDFSDCDGEAP